jgi:hypothetical protein
MPYVGRPARVSLVACLKDVRLRPSENRFPSAALPFDEPESSSNRSLRRLSWVITIPIALAIGVGGALLIDNPRTVVAVALVLGAAVWLLGDDSFEFPAPFDSGADESA